MVTNIVAAGVSLCVVVTGREQGLSGGQIGAYAMGIPPDRSSAASTARS